MSDVKEVVVRRGTEGKGDFKGKPGHDHSSEDDDSKF